jgi:predicted O-methyltransferase YrrM
MDNPLKPLLKRLPPFRRLLEERNDLRAQRDRLAGENQRLQAELERFRTWVEPGHFYSPLPRIEAIREREEIIYGPPPQSLPGIELNPAAQLRLLETFAGYYRDQPFATTRQPGLRYCFEDINYSYADAITLHCMIRHTRPKRIVEVGSGHSSLVMLDTNELFFNHSIDLTLIEPWPSLLLTRLKQGDAERIRVLVKPLQEVDAEVFGELEAGDILFIDSTHVSKIDSDVNRVFFEILPALAPGVRIHFHDVFYPFQYPKEWVYKGIAWNESYLLRAFLQYNEAFRIVFFGTYMMDFHQEWFREHMPLCMKNPGGNIWLERV